MNHWLFMRPAPILSPSTPRRSCSRAITRLVHAAFLCCLAVCGLSARLLALETRQIYDAVAPSTVQIEAFDSVGSGIFLNDKGLILTSYHVVVATPVIKVRAKVKMGTRLVPTEFKDVKLLKVHPQYDLALLEVKPPAGGSFIPAKLVPAGTPVNPGSKCITLGNPGAPGGKAVEPNITEGQVQIAEYELNDQKFIQVIGELAPGHSGGPLCDEVGRVFGIATWNFFQAPEFGFAISTQQINMADFIDQQARPAAPKWVERGELAAIEITESLSGADDKTLLLAIQYCTEACRAWMTADLRDAQPWVQLAKVHRAAKQQAKAVGYLEIALRLDPGHADVCFLQGQMIMAQGPGNKEIENKAMEAWLRGLSGKSLRSGRLNCFSSLGSLLVKRQQWVPLAYLLQWSERDDKDHDSSIPEKDEWWKQVEEKVPRSVLDVVRGKNDQFSKAEFDALVSGKPVTAVLASASAAATPAGSVALSDPIVTPDIAQEEMTRFISEAASKFAAGQVAVPAEGADVLLPDFASDMILAYGGWQAVVTFPDLMKLGIVNLATGKMEGFMDLPDREAMIATGGKLLAIYVPNDSKLRIFELDTRKEVASRILPSANPIVFAGMGALNPRRIFFLQVVEQRGGGYPKFRPCLFHLPEMKFSEVATEFKGDYFMEHIAAKLDGPSLLGSMDEAGRIAVVQHRDDSGVECFSMLQGARATPLKKNMMDGARPYLSQGGGFLIGHRAYQVMDQDPHSDAIYKIADKRFTRLAPVAGYPAVVVMHNDDAGSEFRVYNLPQMNLLATLPVNVDRLGTFNDYTIQDHKEIMLASGVCDRIAFLSPTEKKLRLFPLGLRGGAAGASFAVPGQHFERKLKIAEGSSVTVQSGPPGLKYDATQGALVWDVPADTKKTQVISVVLLLKAADAKITYQVEKISVP